MITEGISFAVLHKKGSLGVHIRITSEKYPQNMFKNGKIIFELSWNTHLTRFSSKLRQNAIKMSYKIITPQPLYNTIGGVQANFRVSYPIRFISR